MQPLAPSRALWSHVDARLGQRFQFRINNDERQVADELRLTET